MTLTALHNSSRVPERNDVFFRDLTRNVYNYRLGKPVFFHHVDSIMLIGAPRLDIKNDDLRVFIIFRKQEQILHWEQYQPVFAGRNPERSPHPD